MISQKQQTAYSDAFSRCYPGKSLEFKRGKEDTTWILIDKDKGSRALSTSEVIEATEAFNA